MVLLTAIEYNRNDDGDVKAAVEETKEKTKNEIHCDEKEERKMMTNIEEEGASDLERNILTAWMKETKPVDDPPPPPPTCCVSWYKFFRFMGKAKGRVQKPESRVSSVRGRVPPLSAIFFPLVFPSAMGGGGVPPLSVNFFFVKNRPKNSVYGEKMLFLVENFPNSVRYGGVPPIPLIFFL